MQLKKIFRLRQAFVHDPTVEPPRLQTPAPPQLITVYFAVPWDPYNFEFVAAVFHQVSDAYIFYIMQVNRGLAKKLLM